MYRWPMAKLKVIGCDPALRNWGLAVGTYCTETKKINVEHLHTVCPVLPTGKQVRQNSLDLESAFQLHKMTIAVAENAHAMFVEVPVGSQSARAMASYGICVGVLGALRSMGKPFFEVTATEVKLAGPGIKTASKQDMIDWAIKQYPQADWPTYTQHGETHISADKANHMADAVAAIHAGVASQPFQQLLAMMPAN